MCGRDTSSDAFLLDRGQVWCGVLNDVGLAGGMYIIAAVLDDDDDVGVRGS
jgi:hypothetical protein